MRELHFVDWDVCPKTLVKVNDPEAFLSEVILLFDKLSRLAPLTTGIEFDGKPFMEAFADIAVTVVSGVDYYLPNGGEHYDRRILTKGRLAKTRRGWLWYGPTLKLLRKAADGNIPLDRVSARPTITEFYFDRSDGEHEEEE